MNILIRQLFLGTPVTRTLYFRARQAYHNRRMYRAAHGYFVNLRDYGRALKPGGEGTVELRTKDGLVLTIRRNSMDAQIVAEIFLDNCYVRDLILGDRPIVVDIGGYIGDFAVYAAKYLNARRVVTCEPSPQNWALLKKNVSVNRYDDRIVTVNKAVTDGTDVMMNVDAAGRGQARVSAYGPPAERRTRVPGMTLSSLVRDYELAAVDLLKIDCEGGEYSILLSTPTEVYSRIRNIVFECHEIEGFVAKLKTVKERLREEGFSLKTRGSLISASRQRFALVRAEPN